LHAVFVSHGNVDGGVEEAFDERFWFPFGQRDIHPGVVYGEAGESSREDAFRCGGEGAQSDPSG
jgi:hypothetical protein